MAEKLPLTVVASCGRGNILFHCSSMLPTDISDMSVATWYVGLHVAESVRRPLPFEIKMITYLRKTKTAVLSANVDMEPYRPIQPQSCSRLSSASGATFCCLSEYGWYYRIGGAIVKD